MPGKAAKVQCTEKQQTILERIARSTTSSRKIVERAQIILMALDQMLNQDIAAEIGLHPDQVGVWRRRWQQSYDALVAIECRESTATLTRSIEQVLSDAPRSGSPGTFTTEEVTQILATACEPPKNSGRPIDNWTHRELTDEVIQRGIVSFISVFLHGLLPRRSCLRLVLRLKDYIWCSVLLSTPVFVQGTFTP